ncbi:MAG: helix-turn-helix transcriptional regulator [Oscillospiraceae bacterium]|nr:helix-turn-helix transcriptional regulator [Oscillospiraceae bacterium]
MNKKTEDLLNQLKIDNISYDTYLYDNQESFLDNDISQFWKKVTDLSGMKKTDIINKADVGYSFFYDILKGKKHPSRDTLIKILIVLSCDLDVFQEALRLYEWAALYPKIKRDSIIIYAINHSFSLYQTEELLQKNNEKVLNLYE